LNQTQVELKTTLNGVIQGQGQRRGRCRAVRNTALERICGLAEQLRNQDKAKAGTTEEAESDARQFEFPFLQRIYPA
jgi:hypothetical protein